MNTNKPISTISYNTIPFLKGVLDNLIQDKVISYYMFIPHIGETDIFGELEKDHIHLYVDPNERINTMDLSDYFKEFTNDNDKPLGCISWHKSKSDDWILYCLHDESYLLSKFEVREYHYNFTQLYSNDEEDLRRRYRSAYQSSGYAKMKNLFQYIKSGGQMQKLLEIGAIPVNQIQNYRDYFDTVKEIVYKKKTCSMIEEELKKKGKICP